MFVQLTGIRIFDNELIVSFGGISIFSWDDHNMNLSGINKPNQTIKQHPSVRYAELRELQEIAASPRSAIGHQPVADSSRPGSIPVSRDGGPTRRP